MSEYPVQARRIDCPLQGNVDVDRCYGCAHFRSVAPSNRGFAIRCNPPSIRVASERQVFVGGFVVRK